MSQQPALDISSFSQRIIKAALNLDTVTPHPHRPVIHITRNSHMISTFSDSSSETILMLTSIDLLSYNFSVCRCRMASLDTATPLVRSKNQWLPPNTSMRRHKAGCVPFVCDDPSGKPSEVIINEPVSYHAPGDRPWRHQCPPCVACYKAIVLMIQTNLRNPT